MNFNPIICAEPSAQLKKRKRRTLLEQSELVCRWKKSGMTQSVFCRENRISLKAFDHWLAREKKGHSKNGKPLLPGKQETPIFSQGRLDGELNFPNGVVLKLPQVELPLLVSLIDEVAQCKFN